MQDFHAAHMFRRNTAKHTPQNHANTIFALKFAPLKTEGLWELRGTPYLTLEEVKKAYYEAEHARPGNWKDL
jgi:hypothetical protein